MIIKSDNHRPATALYLPTNFYDVGAKWRFYTLKHDRRSLWARTKYFGDIAVLDAPPGSLALVPQPAATAASPDGAAAEQGPGHRVDDLQAPSQ